MPLVSKVAGYIHMRLRRHTSIAAILRTFFQVNKFVGGIVPGMAHPPSVTQGALLRASKLKKLSPR